MTCIILHNIMILLDIYWLPGTDSKSRRNHRQIVGFLIWVAFRYPQKHPDQRPAVSGHLRLAPDFVTRRLLGRLQRMVKPPSTEID